MIYPNKFHALKKLDQYLRWACYAALSLSIIFLLESVYSSFNQESFFKTPNDLLNAIQVAKDHINNTRPIELKSNSYNELAQRSLVPLSAEPYLTGVWCPPLWVYRLRQSPQLYPVQTLLASAGYGAFSVNASTSESHSQYPSPDIRPVQNRSTQGYRWVIVTGIIEDREQIEAFKTAFKGTQYYNPGFDYPDYQYFQVERAEILKDTDNENLQWESRPVRKMFDLKNNWSGICNDFVDAKYFPPPRNGISFAFPLGPLVNDNWKDNVGHPQITLSETELQNNSLVKPVSAAIDDGDPFANIAERTALPKQKRGNLASGQNGAILTATEKPDILFLRYIDYDVQPGIKYRYRIKLILQNPNWNVPKKYLETTDIGVSRYLKTAWSKPTPIVSVPPATKMGLMAADARRGYALVKLIHFDLQTGGNQTNEFKVERGEIMNYYNQEYYLPSDSSPRKENDPSALIPSLRQPAESQQVDYVTDKILIDFQAGNRLPGRHRESGPSSILVMDLEGNLNIQGEGEHPIPKQIAIPNGQIAATPRRQSAD